MTNLFSKRGCWVALGCCLWSVPVEAAELQVRAHDQCISADDIRSQVEALVKRPLSELPALSFQVEIGRDAQERWHVLIQSFVPGVARGQRRIEGGACEEVAEAAAVAIALAMSATIQRGEAWPLDERDTLAEQAAPAPPTERTDAPEARSAARPKDAPQAPADVVGARSQPEAGPLGMRVGLGIVLDIGLLPAPAPGAQLVLHGTYYALGLRLYGAMYGSQTHAAEGLRGAGEMALALGGLMACIEHRSQTPHVSACAGAEAAAISGEGRGVDISHERHAWVPVLRADLGLSLPLAEAIGAWLHVGMMIPLNRPEFVLSDGQRVHRVARLAGRGALGIELTL
ncbi:MAG: hypothetical protein OXU20_02865 [Myxococcales bacterium]|nr:hypothetical protein [Myxococcales bacterium]MDD9965157.1 hypothetical protein [Myxococcales bacterium]